MKRSLLKVTGSEMKGEEECGVALPSGYTRSQVVVPNQSIYEALALYSVRLC